MQTTRILIKLVTTKTLRLKETLSKIKVFLKIQLHLQLLSKVPPSAIFLMQPSFFSPTIRKPTTKAVQNTLTFLQNRLNSNNFSNMHVNLVHWNSLHPKKAILATFSINSRKSQKRRLHCLTLFSGLTMSKVFCNGAGPWWLGCFVVGQHLYVRLFC